MSTAPVTDWGTALITSAAAALALLLGAIPRIIGFAVILIVGWIIASALAAAVAAILRTVKFNELAHRAGISGFVQKMGMHTDAAGFLATLVKWFVRLIVLVTAFDALGLPAVSQVLQQILLWLPNLIVALVVLVIAGLAATALSNLVRGATAESGLGNPKLLATIARVAVWAFAIVVAVDQIGIATTIVNPLFMATVGSVAVAVALAFGLGGRETAGQIVQNWYQSGQQAAPRLGQAANAASRQAQAGANGNRVASGPAAVNPSTR
jgi:hypothetical protein